MNLKDYQQPPKKPLSFEEWKGIIPQVDDVLVVGIKY